MNAHNEIIASANHVFGDVIEKDIELQYEGGIPVLITFGNAKKIRYRVSDWGGSKLFHETGAEDHDVLHDVHIFNLSGSVLCLDTSRHALDSDSEDHIRIYPMTLGGRKPLIAFASDLIANYVFHAPMCSCERVMGSTAIIKAAQIKYAIDLRNKLNDLTSRCADSFVNCIMSKVMMEDRSILSSDAKIVSPEIYGVPNALLEDYTE